MIRVTNPPFSGAAFFISAGFSSEKIYAPGGKGYRTPRKRTDQGTGGKEMDMSTQLVRGKLRDAFLQCMKETAPGEITVERVCETAGLEQAAFYDHYPDAPSLLSEIEEEQLDQFRLILRQGNLAGRVLIRKILKSLDRARSLYRMEGDGTLPERVRSEIVAVARTNGLRGWLLRLPKVEPAEAELAYEGLLAASMQTALASDGKDDRDSTVSAIMSLVSSCLAMNGRETDAE